MPEAYRSATLRHYYRHRVATLAKAKQRRDANQAYVNRVKSVPCADCRRRYPPYVMDFDHVRGRKMFQIGGSLHLSLKRIKAEVAKCDVVCANCHRERTHGT